MKTKDIVVGGIYVGKDRTTMRVVNSIMLGGGEVHYAAYRDGAIQRIGTCYSSTFASWAKERVDERKEGE